MTHSRRTRPAAAALALLVAAATAAALLASAATAAGTQVLRISAAAHMRLRFSTSHLTAHPGRVTIIMHDPSNAGMSHGIAITGRGVNRRGPIVSPGHSSAVTATLARGSYEFFCPVPGHAAAGMKGTLTVR